MGTRKKEIPLNKKVNYPDRILSVKEKKAIVKEIKENEYSATEAADIYQASDSTIGRWCRKYDPEHFVSMYKPRKTQSVIRKVVREIEAGSLTKEEAAVKYEVTIKTVEKWCNLYAEAIVVAPIMDKTPQIAPAETDELTQLKLALKYANLKISGLETMIDVAEEEFNIAIRKKPGTKQS